MAGKSPAPLIQSLDSRDHPRVGGEKWLYLDDFFCLAGSPPHRRGKVGLDGGLSEAVGITPAQAGKSKLALCTPSCPTDHPRAGGEKNKELKGVWLPMGSPPRGRGKECVVVWVMAKVGITPAWAGKSSPRSGTVQPVRDHPRVGGEKILLFAASRASVGSPPRRRGKVCPAKHDERQPGITPAHAGKSWARFLPRTSARDHPRVGGEKVDPTGNDWYTQGSPPRGRGKGTGR